MKIVILHFNCVTWGGSHISQ